MQVASRPYPLIVVILDGWGISFVQEGNAIAAANTPSMDTFARYYPTAALHAASIEVGLPWGEIGNSETGHRNIGAGEVQYQALPRIDRAIEDGSFASNKAFQQAIQHVKKNHSQLHLMGLLGPGGVHAHSNHLIALLKLAAEQQLHDNIFLHLFTDGRDTPPQSALTYLDEIEAAIGHHGVGRIASLTGRFYAMDRNENWERTRATYDMLTGGPRPPGASTPQQAIEQSYNQEVFDEMLIPTAITRGGGPITTIKDGDSVIFYNFRPDRARQLTEAFTTEKFTGWSRQPLKDIFFATMTEYDDEFTNAHAAFVDEPLPMPLARIIAHAHLRQLHIAETEKYAHVTYYLNGGHENPFPGEDHILIQSSSIKNFAAEPAMAAREITDRVLAEVEKQTYDIYFINYANADMVGHTANFEAAVKACAFVDECLGRLYQAIVPGGGALLITADHGNAEEMLNPSTGAIETDHTSNPVPLHYVIKKLERSVPRTDHELTTTYATPVGVLADVAPTILDILGIEKQVTMTGISLLSSMQ